MDQKNQQWIYVKRPEGEVTEEHYNLRESEIRQPEDGEVVLEIDYWSVDPYIRIQQSQFNTWEEPHPLNTVQGCGTVGHVIASNDDSLKVGDIVATYSGWQTHPTVKATACRKLDPEQAPVSTALGVLGMPGRTAFFGLLDAGKPVAGETVVVSGAAGAVGSLVCQIAKIKGCRVVGIAGSDDKCEFLKSKLGLDEAVNYRTNEGNMKEALAAVCPNGIDVYFDNTGGPITDAVFELIALRARVVICGQISQYSGGLDKPNLGPRFLHHILYKRATIQGILARDYTPRMDEMLEQMSQWIKEGKIKYRETFMQGFANLPVALNSLFHGKNTGKLIVKK
mmetsp:Transcript_44421/g.111922  ORF Transcript_44421/g.111922 Transcript_44421/m.111922 type:complete len:338 (+) Transcript_44421:219-1232(+)|eukprot:CAMPEP_0177649384 /NCGR_PEP_ID=MMETSP0447-20121125/11355_1 /TAXON_ID=0 /ORGANISM="Stygamoeba regulata, Strain BSH-02190019" /LENGTH=337 /DNA_ID=CAMNT_0019152133 /DNA_START=126 /DNA_END=1139 /DNA_ORIENTATION=+